MINIEEIKSKLIDKLRPSGWVSVLKAFILSQDFDKLIKDLEAVVDDGKRFTPQLKDVFSAFEECKWNDVKVVIIGQDPYPQIGVASGIAFDCSKTGVAQPSLKYMNQAITDTVYRGIPEPERTDLKYLSEQGVLLINTALTTELNKPLTHQKIWKAFLAYVIDTITSNKKDVVFILMGKSAHQIGDLVYDKLDKPETGHYKIEVSHPMSAGYNRDAEWDCKDCFNICNKYLEDNGKQRVKW